MSDDEILIPNEELQSWFSSISDQTWYDTMKNSHDDLSLAYIDLIAEFATSLKSSLRKHSTSNPTPSKTLLLMKSLKNKLSSTIESLFSNPPEDEVDFPDFKDEEELACNLFTRVLDIFRRNNRTVNDLYQDLDANKDGKIRFEELRAEFLKCDPTITIEESKAVFDLLDGNSDGIISIHELTKRTKLIEEKAELERSDPLSCLVISKPLDPDKIHGNLAVMLTKGENLKPGSHSVKIRMPGLLEYVTDDTIEVNPTWNFRADFFFENKTEDELPLLVEVILMNKSKVEGVGSFQWKKTMNAPNEFSLKTKVPIKTSTGQVRGSLNFQAMWTPIHVRVYTEKEKQKLHALEKEILKHKQEIGSQSVDQKDDELFDLSDDESLLVQQPSIVEKALAFSDKHNEKFAHSGVSEVIDVEIVRPNRKTMEIKRESMEEEKNLEEIKRKDEVKGEDEANVEEPKTADARRSRIQVRERRSSYSYLVKVGTVKVQEVIKKSLPQPKAHNKSFQIVIKNRKTVEGLKPVVLNH